eukprot:TRINITY_DN441_c0_g1_i1.p2 TRINITY_DN441_c0_g1~~TRINITY_DN441_c0_g1_i1.p2  ORF type:complete len:157 (-),score=7.33 TRINITY_DN441_c0_g1_i1:92-562(-)
MRSALRSRCNPSDSDSDSHSALHPGRRRGHQRALMSKTLTLTLTLTLPFIQDADAAIADGTFDAVILHEMGHALGFAESLWPLYPSQCGTSCTYFATGAPNGCLASQKFTELGLDGPLPMYFQGQPSDSSFCRCVTWGETRVEEFRFEWDVCREMV